MPDLTTLRAGDSVTIEVEVSQVNDGSITAIVDGYYLHVPQSAITQVKEPKPFDWKDVKPGMAFTISGSLRYFVGPDLFDNNRVLVDNKIVGAEYIYKNQLTPSPEHDIVAQS